VVIDIRSHKNDFPDVSQPAGQYASLTYLGSFSIHCVICLESFD
jgi:hypothetical protein